MWGSHVALLVFFHLEQVLKTLFMLMAEDADDGLSVAELADDKESVLRNDQEPDSTAAVPAKGAGERYVHFGECSELSISTPIQRCRRRFAEIAISQPGLLDDSHVWAHAYDISGGFRVAWHVGVSVYGLEWSFDGYQNPLLEQIWPHKHSFKGVQSSTCKPHQARSWFGGGKAAYHKEYLGRTKKLPNEVRDILIDLMTHEYHPGGKIAATMTDKTYKLSTHNCQDFAWRFVCRLRDRDPGLLPLQSTYNLNEVLTTRAWLGLIFEYFKDDIAAHQRWHR